jgi:hypothetical protein
MAIRDFNNPMGLLGINNNPTGSLGLNISPTFDARAKQAEEDEAKRKRAEQSLKLQNFADTLRMVNANKSGNTQGVALYSNRLANRREEEQARLKAEQAKRDEEKLIASLPPEAQRIYELFGKQAAYNYAYGQPKNNQPSSVKEYEFAKLEGYEGTFNDFLRLKKQNTNINLNNNQNKLGIELAADDYKKKREAAADANSVLTSVDTLENLLDQGVNTGFGSNLGLGFQRIGQTLVGENYKVGDVAGKEAFQAETTKLILPLVKQLGVNPTDKDLDFVRTGAVELRKSEAGNRLMIASLRLSMNRRIDEQNFNQNFFSNPDNENATIYARDVAFQKHRNANPELYTSVSLQQAYDDLLLNQANSNSVITTNEESPF